MPTTEAELYAFLADLGISVSTVRHPPLFTVADSQALRGHHQPNLPRGWGLRTKNPGSPKRAHHLIVAHINNPEIPLVSRALARDRKNRV